MSAFEIKIGNNQEDKLEVKIEKWSILVFWEEAWNKNKKSSLGIKSRRCSTLMQFPVNACGKEKNTVQGPGLVLQKFLVTGFGLDLSHWMLLLTKQGSALSLLFSPSPLKTIKERGDHGHPMLTGGSRPLQPRYTLRMMTKEELPSRALLIQFYKRKENSCHLKSLNLKVLWYAF